MSPTFATGANVNVHITKKHPKYCIEGGDLHVVVDKTLFRIHSHFFTRESTAFHRHLNPVAMGERQKGDESSPILLENIAPEEFEIFLWVFYNPRYSIYDASISDWKVILRLAHEWEFKEVKELVVRELHKKSELKLVDRLALYEAYRVDACHLIPLYGLLCARGTPLTIEESRILGLHTTVLIATMRERLRASPSNEAGTSPLPAGLEMPDVFRALEKELKLEEGVTNAFYLDNRLSLPLDHTEGVPILNDLPNGKAHGSGWRKGPKK